MLRSMFSAISGLRAHQTMMDVTGNNIANVNTAGYKSTRATFQEALTQVTRGATEGTAGGPGGTNPFQVGLGSNVAGIDQNLGQGSVQTTGRTTDLSVSGDGYFGVQGADGVTRYTRAGAFNFDSAGNLVTAKGDVVLGVGGAPVNIDLTSVSDPQIGTDGMITAVDANGDRVDQMQIGLTRFVNAGALTRVGDSMLEWNPNVGDIVEGEPLVDGRGGMQSGTLEMSNVDLAAEFTNMIVAQRGFQANARTITSSDEVLQELVNLKR